MGRAARKSDVGTIPEVTTVEEVEAQFKLRPHAENILVLLDHHNPERPEYIRDRKTAGGIYIPEQVAPTDGFGSVSATVVAIAKKPGHFDSYGRWIPMDPAIVPGARVVVTAEAHGKRADLVGDVIDVNGIEHRMVREHDLGGVEEGS